MDRSLPDPVRALRQELAALKRHQRSAALRQRWQGKVREFPTSFTSLAALSAFNINGFTATGFLNLDPGAWTIHARTIASVENSTTAQNYTGRESFQSRLSMADHNNLSAIISDVDVSYAQPSAAPESFYGSGFLDVQMGMFGLAVSDHSFSAVVRVQCWDTESAGHAVIWNTKIMATPV